MPAEAAWACQVPDLLAREALPVSGVRWFRGHVWMRPALARQAEMHWQ